MSLRKYHGDFELHVTVEATVADEVGRFAAWCAERDFKCVQIVLARGEFANQPMATWRVRNAAADEVVEEGQGVATALSEAGFRVTRVKVEASPETSGVPADSADMSQHNATNYFEHHIKLLRGADAATDALLALCESHGGHLSRNAFRHRDDGRHERFATLRGYHCGLRESQIDLQNFLKGLESLGEQVLECESEYCVFDSNLDLDRGWLDRSSN